MKGVKRVAFAAETGLAILIGIACVKLANAADLLGLQVDRWADAAQARLEAARESFPEAAE